MLSCPCTTQTEIHLILKIVFDIVGRLQLIICFIPRGLSLIYLYAVLAHTYLTFYYSKIPIPKLIQDILSFLRSILQPNNNIEEFETFPLKSKSFTIKSNTNLSRVWNDVIADLDERVEGGHP